MLLTISTSASLTLYSDSPYTPDDLSSSSCCLPQGYVTFTVIEQIIVLGVYDLVTVQADKWVGPGCAIYDVTTSSLVKGISANISSIYVGNTVRCYSTLLTIEDFCSVTLYEYPLNPLGITYGILVNVFLVMSMLSCLWLFYRYYKTSRKPLGLHLIFVLSVSDFLYHLARVMWDHFTDGGYDNFPYAAGTFVLYFSILWSGTMSIIFMKALANHGLFRQFTVKIWIYCLSPSLLLAAW